MCRLHLPWFFGKDLYHRYLWLKLNQRHWWKMFRLCWVYISWCWRKKMYRRHMLTRYSIPCQGWQVCDLWRLFLPRELDLILCLGLMCCRNPNCYHSWQMWNMCGILLCRLNSKELQIWLMWYSLVLVLRQKRKVLYMSWVQLSKWVGQRVHIRHLWSELNSRHWWKMLRVCSIYISKLWREGLHSWYLCRQLNSPNNWKVPAMWGVYLPRYRCKKMYSWHMWPSFESNFGNHRKVFDMRWL